VEFPALPARTEHGSGAEPSPAELQACAAELKLLATQSTVETRISAGQMLLEKLYKNSIQAYNNKKTGKVALERLLEGHGDELRANGWKPHLLRKCIKVAYCVREVLKIPDAKQITSNATFSHLVVLAESPAKEEDARAAYEKLKASSLSVDELWEKLHKEPKPTKPKERARPKAWKTHSKSLLSALKGVTAADLKANGQADAARELMNELAKAVGKLIEELERGV
jgi:hypothetical protein